MRTIITTDANELVAEIHDRMPPILAPADICVAQQRSRVARFTEPYSAGPMRMWPISTRVNKPENDDPSMATRPGKNLRRATCFPIPLRT